MDGIDAVEDRNFQPPFARHILNLADDLVPAFEAVGMGADVEKGSHAAVQNDFAKFLAVEHEGFADAGTLPDADDFEGDLSHLPDLLFQGHLVEEVLHPYLDGGLGIGEAGRQRQQSGEQRDTSNFHDHIPCN
ncbi:MAG: hypothetical protein BWY77_01467 [bacterium ADurb.Bin431]|nr:MAG: hypothetical protein BWY77_01467 [bacterium ADurb.Bin431]